MLSLQEVNSTFFRNELSMLSQINTNYHIALIWLPLICLSRVAPCKPRDCSRMRQIDKVKLDDFVKELGEIFVAGEPDSHEPVILTTSCKQSAVWRVGHQRCGVREGLAPYNSIRQASVALVGHGVLTCRLTRRVISTLMPNR